MKKKIEELLPNIIKKISRGESVSTVDIEKKHGISASSVRAHLNSLEKTFYKNLYSYDGSSKKWVAKEIGFLNKILLKPEEVVILNAIKRNGEKAKGNLSKWYKLVMENYTKRASSFIFKQRSVEDVNEDMEQLFAQMHTAIDNKCKIDFNYYGYKRVLYPYKIVNIEYYWYLLGYEESSENPKSTTEKVKTYKISEIVSLNLSENKFKYDFSKTEEKLPHLMNAYFSPANSIESIYLLVEKSFSRYIDRAKLYSGWDKQNYITTIKDKEYVRYIVGVTNYDFKEIIPTILKYMPLIIVEDNDKLRDKIDSILNGYQELYR